MTRAEAPEAALLPCPDCGEEQVHDVLRARGQGAQHATVSCRQCGRVHRAELRPARLLQVPVIISRAETSQRVSVELPEDEELAVGDELVAAGQQVQVRAIDLHDGKRARRARVRDVATLWVIHFEEILMKVAVNMGRKTISKSVPVSPRDTFNVGDEFDLDKLRVVVHAIKTHEAMLHRGSAEAMDIKRLFCRPKHLTQQERAERRAQLGLPPPKPRRRERAQRTERAKPARVKPGEVLQERGSGRGPPRRPRRTGSR